jgi:tripartite-type tricarboxylate transporter receptor subunit TctC
MKDFTPLTQVMKSATVLVDAPESAPFNTVAELVAYAKANPGKLNFASYSAGSTSHLNGELLMQRTGIQMVHVPYKGTADATRACWPVRCSCTSTAPPPPFRRSRPAG